MNLIRIKFFTLLSIISIVGSTMAQNDVKIEGRMVIEEGKTFSIGSGSKLIFAPGAVLYVLGGLELVGTENEPIEVVNEDVNNPGLGIQIAGVNDKSNIKINHLDMDGFLLPLRFDPFWYRPNVTISNLKLSNSHFIEPVLYVASPFTDLRDDRQIKFELSNSSFTNNSSGVIIENVGSDGIEYTLDNLYFGDNNWEFGDESIGALHLDFANVYNGANVNIGKLGFARNTAGLNKVGLSVSGSESNTLEIEEVVSDAGRVIYDQQQNARISRVNTSVTDDFGSIGIKNYIKSITHGFGSVTIIKTGDVGLNNFRDSLGNVVEVTTEANGDTLQYLYIQGLPKFATDNVGNEILLPSVSIGIDTNEKYITKIDTAEYNKYLKLRQNVKDGQEVSDEIGIGFNLKLPTFAREGEIVKKLTQWEIGAWGGGAIYGGGDIAHKKAKDFKSSPDVVKNTWGLRDIPVVSTIEYSFGAYGQYNLNTRFALKGSFYYSTISMHNLWAPGLFSSGKMNPTVDRNYDEIIPYANTWPNMFITRMYIAEAEGVWFMRSYNLDEGKKSKLVPSLGLSLGFMYFNPYRIAYTGQKSWETFAEYKSRMYSDHMYSLRDLGFEGQNFLPGKEPYSSLAALIGTSFNLTWLRKRFAYKGEVKFTYTSTDYLDDFGPGNWYGGDIDAVRDNSQIDNLSRAGDLTKITSYNDKIAPNAQRSTNGLNDWYFQLHLGMSYRLFKK